MNKAEYTCKNVLFISFAATECGYCEELAIETNCDRMPTSHVVHSKTAVLPSQYTALVMVILSRTNVQTHFGPSIPISNAIVRLHNTTNFY